ncbi:hypothetical protein DPSP01_010927 [Paraphaeosphaeria sporulosa]
MSSPSHSLPHNNLFRPAQPTPLQRFLRKPLLFIATYLYTHQPPLKQKRRNSNNSSSQSNGRTTPHHITVVCLSDTHNTQPLVPAADILLHAGDLTQNGTFAELQATLDWLAALPHRHKFVIAGNHDLLLSPSFVASAPSRVFTTTPGCTKEDLEWGDVTYLEDSSATVTVRGRDVKIWGAPWTPKYGNWAFQYPPGEDVWQGKIPGDADIVVTHGPAQGHLDVNGMGHAGCAWMGRELERVKPRLAVYGHIHEARGREYVRWDRVQRMYEGVLGCPVEGCFVFEVGVGAWVWSWVRWAFGVRREPKTTFVNSSTVGHWGVAEGMVVEM